MDNKKKILNEAEGEISLALVGLIMKKIKKVAFQVVYEKLLKDGDARAHEFFKIQGADKFTINNYEDLLNLEKTNTPPTAAQMTMQNDDEQIKNLTSKESGMGAQAIQKLDKLVKSNDKDKSIFNSVSDFLKNLFALGTEENEEELQENEEENPESGQTEEDSRKILKQLIYKYDPFKNTHNTHIFPHTELEKFFVKKRTGLEKVFTIADITVLVKRAASIYHHLKKIRLTIMKVQKASRDLHGQKTKDNDEVKTIGDILSENDNDNLIKSFVLSKGKIGLNPFAIADELLYSVYGEEKLKTFMKQAEEMHDELNEVSQYVVKVLKSRKLVASGEEEKVTGIGDEKTGTAAIENALKIYKSKIEKKYKLKKSNGEVKDVNINVLNILDMLANAVNSQTQGDPQ